ncbi:MAG: hypothetical protein FGM14_02500 [Flavobacteriales bacterium]|nr:hypothetical protein [Flavobacteriales bacterium]
MNLLLKSVFIVFFLSSYYINAQISVVKDERIDQKISNKAQKQILGYRVQICFDSDKNLVDQMRAKFISQYPKIDTYVTFDAPNFNLKVGDFRTQIEAEKLKEKIIADYSITIIHKELINLPRVD